MYISSSTGNLRLSFGYIARQSTGLFLFETFVFHFHMQSQIVCFTFRYIGGSTKEATRCRRQKGASRMFYLKQTSGLPAQTLLLSVTSNKVQIINMIIKDLKDHKDDPVAHTLVITGPDPVSLELPGLVGDNDSGVVIPRHDLRNTHEEADRIIDHQETNNICCSVKLATSHLL